PLSYVCNTGMIDGPGTPATGSAIAYSRDFKENGVFHDLFQGNPQNPAMASQRLPMVRMTKQFISSADGVQMTLMFSENLDAGNYTDQYEHQVGFIWNPGQVTPA